MLYLIIFVPLCVNFLFQWHLVPVDVTDTHHFGEHDGCFDTMCAIIEAKVHASDTGSRLVSIVHSEVAPFRIENRSSTHYIRFVQDDTEAVVFELPPMFSCAYTWDSPLGKKKLRAVVIPEASTRKYKLEAALKLERDKKALEDKDRDNEDCEETLDTVDSDDETETIDSETPTEPLLHSLRKGTRPDARELNKTARYGSPRKGTVFTLFSRSYNLSKVKEQKDLPCPLADESASGYQQRMSSNLFAYTRIEAGTKVLSFSDSTFLRDQVQANMLKFSGDFLSALFDLNVEGLGLYVLDDFPKEVLAIIVRDIQIQKQMGSIESTLRVRHFQVDAMLPNARYPIIIEPLPMGVDRRDNDNDSSDLVVPEDVDKRECFWTQNDEKPIPVFEISASYVPQVNILWVPNLNIFICPLKLHIDVDYILRIAGMIVDAVYKYQDDTARNLTTTSHANDRLEYITHGQLHFLTFYIEKLFISPCHFDIELNIKSDDPDDAEAAESSLTLHSIAQTTNSGMFSK